MYGDDAINEEMSIAAERADEGRKVLDQMMIREPIRRLDPRVPPVCVEAGQVVAEAVELMGAHTIGSVLVTKEGRLIGILTERDILRKVTAVRADPADARVEDVMTASPETLTLDDPIVFALNKMGVGGFRHVPLINEDGRPVGIISVRHRAGHGFRRRARRGMMRLAIRGIGCVAVAVGEIEQGP